MAKINTEEVMCKNLLILLFNVQHIDEEPFTQPRLRLSRPGPEQTGEIAHNLLTGTLRRTAKTRAG